MRSSGKRTMPGRSETKMLARKFSIIQLNAPDTFAVPKSYFSKYENVYTFL